MDKKKNIVLIGMMGCGKSTIGQLLNEKLEDFEHIDIDTEIEKHTQKPITEIFSQYGEPYFRELEHEMIKKYYVFHSQIISTGGGVIENKENINLLKQNGIIYYLKASVDELFERVRKSSERPLLNHKNPKERLEELIRKREPFYKTADFEIDTEKQTLENIADEILKNYESVI